MNAPEEVQFSRAFDGSDVTKLLTVLEYTKAGVITVNEARMSIGLPPFPGSTGKPAATNVFTGEPIAIKLDTRASEQ